MTRAGRFLGLVMPLLASLLLPGAASAPARPITVVSFNMFHGGMHPFRGGDAERLDERLAMTVGALRALDADVAGLQEASVGRTRGDVAARLAEALGFAHVRASARYRGFGPLARWATGFAEGPAILSRFPIRTSESIRLDACDGWYERVLLCAVVAAPGGDVDVCSTHVAGDACQLRSLRTHLRDRRTGRPLILTGDLNSVADAPGVHALVDELGLVDAFRAANPEAPGFTVWQPVRQERPSARRRVDYVLLAPGRARSLAVRASRVVLDAPRTGGDGRPLWPSDHHGVLARVVMAPAPPAGGTTSANHHPQ